MGRASKNEKPQMPATRQCKGQLEMFTRKSLSTAKPAPRKGKS